MSRQRNAPIKVLVVDDSTLMRTALRKIIESDEDIAVVGESRNGEEAIEAVKALHPDVVTMDVEMPVMDGIAAVRALMAQPATRVPVIMVSQHTQSGEKVTVEALMAGAVDYVSKSSNLLRLDINSLSRELLPKIRLWADDHFSTATAEPPRKAVPAAPARAPAMPEAAPAAAPESCPIDLVVIAVSTGGPATLLRLLAAMGPLPVPTVVAQHMPASFTKTLAENLAAETGLTVVEGVFGSALVPGAVTILPGGKDSKLVRLGAGSGITLVRAQGDGNIHPSADILFQSALRATSRPVGVILTGMGCDGTAGAGMLRAADRPVLVQDPAMAIVPGMPSAAIEAGFASQVLGVEQIGARIAAWAAGTLEA